MFQQAYNTSKTMIKVFNFHADLEKNHFEKKLKNTKSRKVFIDIYVL